MRVLLVEDEARIADFIRKGLSEYGYAVDSAGDGEEALRPCSLYASGSQGIMAG